LPVSGNDIRGPETVSWLLDSRRSSADEYWPLASTLTSIFGTNGLPVDDLLEVTLVVTTALEGCGIRYTVGGSLASSFSGEPRASIDAEILIQMTEEDVEAFVASLGRDFYSDAEGLRRAIRTGASTNLVHRPTGIKVDLFAASSFLDAQQLERRKRIQVSAAPDRFLYVHSPEDILLQKLHWYRLGGHISDRQWRDALSIVLVQGPRIDREYLSTMADRLDLTDLLGRALRESGTLPD
jgi:hypothetical protein